jgi:hypothetical protein
MNAEVTAENGPQLVDWARAHLLTSLPPLDSPEAMAIPRCVATADEAITVIREHHARWQTYGTQA